MRGVVKVDLLQGDNTEVTGPPIYLDYHATTPVDDRVLGAMLPFFSREFGNAASSTHSWGWRAKEAVEQARRQIAALVGAQARELVFTSGATESNNLALRGVTAGSRRSLVVSAIEHKSVLEVARARQQAGFHVAIAPVDPMGRLDLAALQRLVTPDTAIVSVMAANNEIGVTQPLADIAAIAHANGALLHVDAAQAVGKIPIDVSTMGIDLLSLTAHKIYGPKGCGALFVRRGIEIEPLLLGGGHERGLRAGTLNVPGIVGLGEACAICRAEMDDERRRVGQLRDRLLAGLREGLDDVVVNGSMEHRLANNLHVTFGGVDGESLILAIGDIAVSSGSACSSASGTPSHVLQAITGDRPISPGAIRFGLGRFTTGEEIDQVVERFVTVVRHLRDAEAHASGRGREARV